jgi:hypothetical protein
MNAQQRQKRELLCQDEALLNKYSDGTALMDEEKKRVQRLQKNAQQRKCRCKDTALWLKSFTKNAHPLTDVEEKRVLQLNSAQIKKHWKRYYCNTRAAGEDEYYSWRNTFLHKRRQDWGVVPMMQSKMLPIVELENEYDRNFS